MKNEKAQRYHALSQEIFQYLLETAPYKYVDGQVCFPDRQMRWSEEQNSVVPTACWTPVSKQRVALRIIERFPEDVTVSEAQNEIFQRLIVLYMTTPSAHAEVA